MVKQQHANAGAAPVDPDMLLKQTFQIVNTTMNMLPYNSTYKKKFLARLVGMIQCEQRLSGQYHAAVDVPQAFKQATH